MNSLTSLLILALTLATVHATKHTVCFQHFMKQKGCVYSAASEDLRCKVDPQGHPAPVHAFSLQNQQPPALFKRDSSASRLMRRYDDLSSSFTIAGGPGICGNYTDEDLGVCLWSGADQDNPTIDTAGWLNGAKTSNCGKRVYIQRTGDPSSVQFAKVVDGCYFNAKSEDPGCFEIGVTKALFDKFKPTEEERKKQLIIGGMTWDFDNLLGTHSQQGPV